MPDFWSAIEARTGKPSPESGDMSELLDSVSDVDPGPGKPWPEPGDKLGMAD